MWGEHMLRIAILETEAVTKAIMYTMAQQLQEEDCCFYCFQKISQFARAEAEKEFHMVIFHESMEVPRITQSFVLSKPQRIVIYVKTSVSEAEKTILPFARIFYIERAGIEQGIEHVVPYIKRRIRSLDEYMFSYNNVNVPLKIRDIYYIEKVNKMLIYHTRRGEFQERKNMRDAYADLCGYHFVWIHATYLVNMDYILKIESDTVILPHLRLPISRSKKAEVMQIFHEFIQKK